MLGDGEAEQIYQKFWAKRGHCHLTVHPIRRRAELQWLSHGRWAGGGIVTLKLPSSRGGLGRWP